MSNNKSNYTHSGFVGSVIPLDQYNKLYHSTFFTLKYFDPYQILKKSLNGFCSRKICIYMFLRWGFVAQKLDFMIVIVFSTGFKNVTLLGSVFGIKFNSKFMRKYIFIYKTRNTKETMTFLVYLGKSKETIYDAANYGPLTQWFKVNPIKSESSNFDP